METTQQILIESTEAEIKKLMLEVEKEKEKVEKYEKLLDKAIRESRLVHRKLYKEIEELCMIKIGAKLTHDEASRLMRSSYYEVDKRASLNHSYNKMIEMLSERVKNKMFGFNGPILILCYVMETEIPEYIDRAILGVYREWRKVVFHMVKEKYGAGEKTSIMNQDKFIDALMQARVANIMSNKTYNQLARCVARAARPAGLIDSSVAARLVAELVMSKDDLTYLDGVGKGMQEEVDNTRRYMSSYLENNRA